MQQFILQPDWIKYVGITLLGISVTTWVYFWFQIWLKYGKEHKITKFPGPVKSPPSPLPPAVVESLLSQGQKVTVNSFIATILDLARRNIITIEAMPYNYSGFLGIGKGTAYNFILHLADKEVLDKIYFHPFEADLINFIFSQADDNKTILLEQMANIIEQDPYVTKSVITNWIKQVKKDSDRYDYLEPESKKWRRIFLISNTIFIITVFAASIRLTGLFNSVQFISTILSLGPVVAVINGNLFLRWNKNSQSEVLKWEKFKNYLEDFPYNLDEISRYSSMWEDVLIYGIVFGINKEIEKYLPDILSKPGTVSHAWFVVKTSDGKDVAGLTGADLATCLSKMIISSTNAFNGTSGGGFEKSQRQYNFRFL